MKVLNRSTVIDCKDLPDTPSQTFPGIAVTPSGRIIVSWRNSPQKIPLAGQRVLYSFSDDNGRSWSKPADVFIPPEENGKSGTFRAGFPSWINGKLVMTLCRVDSSIPGKPFFNEETQGLLDCTVYFAESEDEGRSWSRPQRIDPAPFAHLSTPITGAAQVFSDGEMIVQFELNKPYDSTDVWRHLPVLKFSRGGRSDFDRYSIPASAEDNSIFYWDQRPVVLKNDELADFFWTWDNVNSVYHNISMSHSADRGRSWSKPADTGVSGQPGQPVEFADGSLLLPLVDRSGKPEICARISMDKGKTFTGEVCRVSNSDIGMQTARQQDLNGAWDEMGKFSLGLPSGAASGHNTAYIVWYEGKDTDHTSIKFAEIAP